MCRGWGRGLGDVCCSPQRMAFPEGTSLETDYVGTVPLKTNSSPQPCGAAPPQPLSPVEDPEEQPHSLEEVEAKPPQGGRVGGRPPGSSWEAAVLRLTTGGRLEGAGAGGRVCAGVSLPQGTFQNSVPWLWAGEAVTAGHSPPSTRPPSVLAEPPLTWPFGLPLHNCVLGTCGPSRGLRGSTWRLRPCGGSPRAPVGSVRPGQAEGAKPSSLGYTPGLFPCAAPQVGPGAFSLDAEKRGKGARIQRLEGRGST